MCFISFTLIFELGCTLTKAGSFLSHKKSLPDISSKTVFSRTSNAIINSVMIHYLLKRISSCTTFQYLGLYIH